MYSFSCSAAWNFLAECLSVGGVYGGWPSKAPFLFWGKAAMMPARSLNKAMMLKGKIDEYIRNFYAATRNALLVTGARQTGKTYSIREFGKTFKSFIEIILRTT